MQKKWLPIIGFFIMLHIPPSPPSPVYSQENLLKNPSFEEIDASSLPIGWNFSAYSDEPGITEYSASTDHPNNGERSCYIRNRQKNHSVFEQEVAVEELSVYLVSGVLRTRDVGDENTGAGISVNDKWELAGDFTGTHEDWEYIELYVVTGRRATSVIVKLNIGIYGSENAGEAWFEDLSMIKTDILPASVLLSIVDPSAKSREPQDVIIWTIDDILHPIITLDGLPLVLLIAFVMLMISVIFYYVYLRMIRNKGAI